MPAQWRSGWAVICCAAPLPAAAIVVDQRAFSQSLILLFVGFAVLVFQVLLALVALLTKPPQRRIRLRSAAIVFATAAVAATLALAAVRAGFSRLDTALPICAILLVAVALALLVHAVVASRRSAPS